MKQIQSKIATVKFKSSTTREITTNTVEVQEEGTQSSSSSELSSTIFSNETEQYEEENEVMKDDGEEIGNSKEERISEGGKKDENGTPCNDDEGRVGEEEEEIVDRGADVVQVKTEKKKRPSFTKEERLERKRIKFEQVKKKSGELVTSLVYKALKKKLKKDKTKATKKRTKKKIENEEKIESCSESENIQSDKEEEINDSAEVESEQELGGLEYGGDFIEERNETKPLWLTLMEKMERDLAVLNVITTETNEIEIPQESTQSPPSQSSTQSSSQSSSAQSSDKDIEEEDDEETIVLREKPKQRKSKSAMKTKVNKRVSKPKRKLITSDINTNEDYEKNRKRTKQTKILSFFQTSQVSSQ